MSSWKIYSDGFDRLFHISVPESKKRKKAIKKIIESALNESQTFHLGVACIKTFVLTKLEKKFKKIIINNSKEFGKRDVIAEFFPEGLEKIQTLASMDEETRKELDEFLLKSFKQIELNEHQFKQTFTRVPYGFVLDDARLGAMLFNIITFYDKSTLLDWSKYFKFIKITCPECLQISECKCYSPDANKFIEKVINTKRIDTEKIQFPDADIKPVIYFGKTYKCIYIDKPETLFTFFLKNLVHNRGYIGIYWETNDSNEVCLIQLAAYGWAVIIDVQVLSKKISRIHWRIFFEYLFTKSTIVGFSFHNDLDFLSRTFPYVKSFLGGQKVLCLQKFANKIMKENPNEKRKFFPFNEQLKFGAGLANLAKAVKDIVLDKSEQQSNWTQRPLSEKQINYAFGDAIIPILIHDEMRRLGAATEVEIECFVTLSK
uniref:3'-5' exonuclease domain-containing protein n=1 Tax=Panagrolaimus davidi TaxID=227884 RepID=A0A914PYS9_9BILA